MDFLPHHQPQVSSLHQLALEKKRAAGEAEMAVQRLEEAFASLPGLALGGMLSIAAGAIVKGIKDHLENRQQSEKEEVPSEHAALGETLKEVGSETALFALSKLVEKLITQRR